MIEKGIFYNRIKALSDTLDFTLQLRKAVMEEYPILNWTERKLQGVYQWAKDGFLSNSDKFGNYIYNKNWGVVSNFAGGLFNASDMKENSGVAASVGSFFNGVLGHGVLGTVDGVATAVKNPFGTIEGINNVVGDPGAAFSAFKKETRRIWDEELVNGSWEDRSRVVGAAAFEVVTTAAGASAAKAGKAAKAAKEGDKAADLGKAAKVADAIDNMVDTAKATRKAGKLSGALDRASDIGKASRAALSSIKTSATEMIDRALTSNTVKKAARKADDFIRDVRSMLTPPELQPALVTGVLDDADDVGFFTKYYDDLVKKKKTSLSESGVKIEKAEIVGGSGDVVDGAGDLGGVVKKGNSGVAEVTDNPSIQLTGTSYDINQLHKTQPYTYQENIDIIKEAIIENGPNSITPIEVRVHNGQAIIVEGHHRLEAFRQLGYDRVPIKYIHGNQLGKLQKDRFIYYRSLQELLDGLEH